MKRWLPRLWIAPLLVGLGTPQFACGADTYRVVAAYPHDAQAFTQGLIFLDGRLYESTGLNARSSLRREELATGQVLQEHDVPPRFFAEGLTNWGGTLIQLTWQAHTAFVYDRASFKLLRTFHYEGEGWGLTQGRQAPDPERQHFLAALSESGDVCGGADDCGERPRQAGRPAE